MKSSLIGLFILGSIGGGTLLYLAAKPDSEAAVEADKEGGLHTVRRGDLEIVLVEDGTLVAKNARKVLMKARRGGKIISLVEEGKVVEEGEVLCTFDTTDLVQRIEQLELELVQSKTNLISAETELEIQQAEGVSRVEKAKLQVERSRQDLERYRDGDAPMARRKLRVAIKDASTTYNLAKKRYADSKRLYKEKYIKRSELEGDQISFEKAKVVKEGAELALKIFDKYTYPMTLRDKQTKVSDAKRDVTTAEKRAKSRLLHRKVGVTHNQKRVARIKRRLTQFKKDLAGMVLKSPCPGIVIYGDPKGHRWFRRQVKVGGHIWGGNTVMTIPDLRVMQVKISVHEADINKIKKGLPATITMDTYTGLVLSGKVTRIAAIASAPGGGDQTKSEVKKFDVEITIEGSTKQELKPGISAKATILIDTRPDALSVPLQCVFLEKGTHYCYVLGSDGKPARREVEVGLSGEHFLEIKKGLTEGEQVLLYNPNLPTESKTVSDEAGAKTGAKTASKTAGAASGKTVAKP